MGSKSKDKSLLSEQMLIKQFSLAHLVHIKCNTFIRILISVVPPIALEHQFAYVFGV
jgi:hypothetical protein